jgi:hypothetical protein
MRYPIIVDATGPRESIRRPVRGTKFIKYTLTFEDVYQMGFLPLEVVARKVWGNDKYWVILADNNQLRHPKDWKVGDTILIPTDVPQYSVDQ